MPRHDSWATSASASDLGTWRPPVNQKRAAISAAPHRPAASSSARSRPRPVSAMIVSVIASRQPLRGFLQLLDRSRIWPTLAAGCHPARDTGAAIEAAGFTMERYERFGFAAGPMQPKIPHILGTARL